MDILFPASRRHEFTELEIAWIDSRKRPGLFGGPSSMTVEGRQVGSNVSVRIEDDFGRFLKERGFPYQLGTLT